MKNILISLGSVIREKGLFEEIKPISDKTFFLIEKKHKFLYKNLLEKQKIYFERNLMKKEKYILSKKINTNLIYKITEEILKDQNSYFILSRCKLSYYEYSPMRLNDIAVHLINKAIDIILTNKIEYFIVHNTPHSENWFLFRTAEIMGKKVYVIRESIIPGYSRFYSGLKNQKIVNSGGDNFKLKAKIINTFFKEKTNSSYLIPELQNKRKNLYREGFSGLIPEIKFFLKEDSFNLNRTIKAKLSVIKTVILKKESLNFYQDQVAVKKNIDLKNYDPYVVYFMQYQPERTSIPEADSFSYQYKTILLLRNLLPKNINLLIKEHPDTYRNKFSARFKSKETYKNILSLPGVFFCDMNIDPYTLLDNSIITATLTGNVGIESICRGKKLIYFGNPIYKDYHYSINGCDKKFKTKLKKFLEMDQNIEKEYIKDYLKKFINYSYKNNFDNFSINLLNHLIKLIEID